MVRLNLSELKEMSKQRPAGYLEEILKLGKSDGDGVFLEDSDYQYLVNKYTNSKADAPSQAKTDTENTAASKSTSAKISNLNNYK
jgi:hypothetical protein